jgi:hypothetical protein
MKDAGPQRPYQGVRNGCGITVVGALRKTPSYSLRRLELRPLVPDSKIRCGFPGLCNNRRRFRIRANIAPLYGVEGLGVVWLLVFTDFRSKTPLNPPTFLAGGYERYYA